MASLSGRVRAALRSEHGRRLVKFAAVSVISTVLTQVILLVTYDALSLASAMVCNVIATSIATPPAYWLNRTWTWGKRGKSHPWREVAPFWIIAFIGLVLSTVAVGLASHNSHAISSSHVVQRAFVQVANLFAYGVIWVGRYFIFNRFLFGADKIGPDVEVEVPGEVEAIALEEHRVHEHHAHGAPSGDGALPTASR